ncbi:MAG: hypothetical protein LZF64_05300 [Nitrosomonas sp.]|uniref:hypothetical protein n=1 Tax=Nitrosomonas sp. TaxID=42353 RepID=UPI001A571F60|nr:hypothetical protein [Nitrosomonas sp.]MBL8499003.1 hypothetical protein [Nitrosomonas sp.]MCG7756476.1 hypothetical protein [Nitrosomonas sp.]UJP01186.1 MAG: hypothetical protein LZF64_05300 [Nitrosomonas sp.]UJP02016.1 MAG: hypothetical protein LZF85_09495 [Nitrosomonas sp.]UJP07346.1 MAG: hypothetical protein LZF84_09970 [Nitrosomonas sp.]
MPKLRLKIIKQKVKKQPLQSRNLLKNINCFALEKINKILDNDVLPLIIAPSIFMIFAGLEWWRWYLEIPTPIPLLLTIFALGLGIYCSYKLLGHRKNENKQQDLPSTIDQHPELH